MTGPLELIILLFLVFLILGPKRITALFRSLGRGVRDFTNEIGRDKPDEQNKELPHEDDAPRDKD